MSASMLALALAACSTTPQSSDANDPYANGAQYPWTDTTGAVPQAVLSSGYLSDQAWTSAYNGWGPIEKNKSNGEQNAGDGRTITIAGTTYAKGLGAHANSRIQYDLGGACSRFKAVVGVDDEVPWGNTSASVRFEVWAGGTNLYNSGRLTRSSGSRTVDVSVSGRYDLVLYIYDDGNGNAWDHADWADARVECGSTSSPPPSPTPPPPAPPSPPPSSGKPTWGNVYSWGIQYHGFNSNSINAIDAVNVGLVVLGRFDGSGREWTYNDINRLRQKKWVLSYLSVGQAQTIEWYWQSWWSQGNPWYIANPWTYGGTYNVRYWASEWQNLMYQSIDRIINAGFDGVFFDQSDPYWNPGFPGGASYSNMQASKDLVCNIANYARSKKWDFKVMVNGGGNQIELFGSSYWNCFDANAGEHLYYDGDGRPGDAGYRSYTVPQLKRLVAAGKKVFTFDYTTIGWEINSVLSSARNDGFIPTVTRSGSGVTPVAY